MPKKPKQIIIIGVWLIIHLFTQYNTFVRSFNLNAGGDIVIDRTGKDLPRLFLSLLVMALFVLMIYIIINFFRVKTFAIKFGRIYFLAASFFNVVFFLVMLLNQAKIIFLIFPLISIVPSIFSVIYLFKPDIIELSEEFEQYYSNKKKLKHF